MGTLYGLPVVRVENLNMGDIRFGPLTNGNLCRVATEKRIDQLTARILSPVKQPKAETLYPRG